MADWETFFVIVGGSAGALTGLMFVVVTLSQEMRSPNAPLAMRSFATPTIVHFTTVLSLAALLSMPRLTPASMGAILLTVGGLLLCYMLWIFLKAREQDVYVPDLEDWTWHFCLPTLAYIAILGGGISSWGSPDRALRIVAGAMLALLVVGIHNAWDSAVWTVVRNNRSQQ